MKDLLVLAAQLITAIAQLLGPGGARGVVADSRLVSQTAVATPLPCPASHSIVPPSKLTSASIIDNEVTASLRRNLLNPETMQRVSAKTAPWFNISAVVRGLEVSGQALPPALAET